MSTLVYDTTPSQIGTRKVTNRKVANPSTTGNTTVAANVYGNIRDRATLEARLIAINAGYWTTNRLKESNYNDLIYALRMADDPLNVG